MQGLCFLSGRKLRVLFDSGATHSFVSLNCVEKLDLPVRDLACELFVSTPASDLVVASKVCCGCPLVIEGRRFKVNLICLPLRDLDVVLGMDWLAQNNVLIDCGQKKLLFPESEEFGVLFAS